MALSLQPVRVETGGPDEEGLLVFNGGKMVALLVRLSDGHEAEGMAGQWFLEVGLGPLDEPAKPTFSDIEAAGRWIARRLAATRGKGASAHANGLGASTTNRS